MEQSKSKSCVIISPIKMEMDQCLKYFQNFRVNTDVISPNEEIVAGYLNSNHTDLIVIHIKNSNLPAIELIKLIKSIQPYIYIAVIVDQQDLHLIVEPLRLGAFDYIVKGENEADQIKEILHRMETLKQILKSNKINTFVKEVK